MANKKTLKLPMDDKFNLSKPVTIPPKQKTVKKETAKKPAKKEPVKTPTFTVKPTIDLFKAEPFPKTTLPKLPEIKKQTPKTSTVKKKPAATGKKEPVKAPTFPLKPTTDFFQNAPQSFDIWPKLPKIKKEEKGNTGTNNPASSVNRKPFKTPTFPMDLTPDFSKKDTSNPFKLPFANNFTTDFIKKGSPNDLPKTEKTEKSWIQSEEGKQKFKKMLDDGLKLRQLMGVIPKIEKNAYISKPKETNRSETKPSFPVLSGFNLPGVINPLEQISLKGNPLINQMLEDMKKKKAEIEYNPNADIVKRDEEKVAEIIGQYLKNYDPNKISKPQKLKFGETYSVFDVDPEELKNVEIGYIFADPIIGANFELNANEYQKRYASVLFQKDGPKTATIYASELFDSIDTLKEKEEGYRKKAKEYLMDNLDILDNANLYLSDIEKYKEYKKLADEKLKNYKIYIDKADNIKQKIINIKVKSEEMKMGIVYYEAVLNPHIVKKGIENKNNILAIVENPNLVRSSAGKAFDDFYSNINYYHFQNGNSSTYDLLKFINVNLKRIDNNLSREQVVGLFLNPALTGMTKLEMFEIIKDFTPEEKTVINYYYGLGDNLKADGFMIDLITTKRAQKLQDAMTIKDSDSNMTKVVKTGGTLGAYVANYLTMPMYGISTAVSSAASGFDPYALPDKVMMTNYGVFHKVYDNNMEKLIPNPTLRFLVKEGLDLTANTALVVSSGGAGSVFSALSSAGEAALESAENGGTQNQQLANSLADGTISAFTAMIPFDELGKTVTKNMADGLAKDIASAAVSEFGSEVFGDVYTMAQDIISKGDKSEIIQYVDNWKKIGGTVDKVMLAYVLKMIIETVNSRVIGVTYPGLYK